MVLCYLRKTLIKIIKGTMEGHKCKEQIIGSGFMKWNAWTAATNIMQTAAISNRENARIVRAGSRNLNKFNIGQCILLLEPTILPNEIMFYNNLSIANNIDEEVKK